MTLRGIACLAAVCLATQAQAAPDESATSNDYGNIGLLQTPNARFSGGGELRVGYASAKPYNVTFISAQPFDWLEATFRYTNFSFSGVDGGPFVRDGFLDKSFDIKLGLLAETELLPAVAVGIQDLGGTGLLASEYVVMSKRWGDFDLSLGAGWGRLGARGSFRNPLISLNHGFAEREGFGGGQTGDLGGEFELEQLFAGERMDAFASVRWAPADSRWSVAVERDGNDYSLEPFGNDLPTDLPVNIGANYQAPTYGLRLGWVRGNQLTFSLYLANDVSQSAPKPLDPPPTPVAETYAAPDSQNRSTAVSSSIDDATFRAIRQALQRQHIQLLRAESAILGWQLNVWVTQGRYRNQAELHDRVARTLSMLADRHVARFQIISVAGGLERSRVKIDRATVQRVASRGGALGSGASQAEPTVVSLAPVVEDPALPDSFLDVSWFTGPRYRQSGGDPDESYRAGLYWQFGADKPFDPYLSLSVRAEVEVVGNIDEIERESDSLLPRVRSDIAEYNRQGKHGLRRLELNYIRPITSEWWWRVSAGIFEEMYGGIAGEVLYRPHAQHWALGVNLNRVRQRDFDQRFDFRDYEVTTGHLTAYRSFPKLHLDTQVSVGCYLAGDCGGTVIAARVFDSGARFGVFATKTDVSAREFGEGSFDKGFFIVFPFDLFLPRSSRASFGLSFRPLTRDGGQKVNSGRNLRFAGGH